MGKLSGKVAIVTGGVSGIGLATVERFIEEGAKVAVGDVQNHLGAALLERFPHDLIYQPTDVTLEAAVEALVQVTVDRFGRLDIMFNNAGSAGDQSALLDLSSDGIARTLALLTTAVVLGHKYASRQFIKQGTGGAIISTASVAGIEGGWSTAAYSIAKHGVIGVVHQAVAELSQYGIRSNAICPGITMTPIMAHAFGVPTEKAGEFEAFLDERLGTMIPSRRVAYPRDIANAALYLASDDSSYVNGAVLPVDGGASAILMAPLAQAMVQAGADFNALQE